MKHNTAPNLRAILPSPEQMLRVSFAREDELLAELVAVRIGQRQARAAYAEAHGLLILPSLAKLREVLRP